ncbi:DEAD/DEAH box helicase [Muricoccus pecuniae]|uniref:ATP-dependent RNA helicase DeaD n=1 Tax=Muricoccus pecuniae TaxID=693023 RepID=A0A840YJN5_9PROT|nr:DEAD/DEAH box helicase [Roseomonas pecuniae]MBB5694234.1 ATP-dependent RNA helicase DeaD [Roseomonas pecuniae]
MAFDTLPPPLRDALSARGYANPTPVQAAVLAEGTAGRDLLVSARTGSGKTVAYGLAMAGELLGEAPRLPAPGAPLALIVAPTRELALQVKTELTWLYGPAGGRVASCVGGMDPAAERRVLQSGVHIAVGTPGRVRDHIERGNLKTDAVRAVVLDEADEMLDLGFREELEAILGALPAERRTLLFSATVPAPIARMAKQFQRDALRIEATSGDEPHGDIAYRAALVAPGDVERAVVNALRLEGAPISMVFCSTRAAVARLHGNLTERGFHTVALSGELSQAERTRALQSLRDGHARICVATDVAARGIDLPELDLVIHAELPRDPETLLHRSGRTGRAGRKGVSLLIVPPSRRRIAERLLYGAKIEAEWGPAPSAEAVRARDAERIAGRATEILGEEAAEEDLAIARTLTGLSGDPAGWSRPEDGAAPSGIDPLALAAALVKLIRAPLPAPEELSSMADRGRRAPGSERGFERDGGRGPDRGYPDGPRGAGGPPPPSEGVWFRVSVGRDGQADPRWMLPFLCKRGDVSRAEIGRIRIQGRESQVEIAPYAAAHFAAAVRRPGGEDAHILVEPMQPLPRAPRQRRA